MDMKQFALLICCKYISHVFALSPSFLVIVLISLYTDKSANLNPCCINTQISNCPIQLDGLQEQHCFQRTTDRSSSIPPDDLLRHKARGGVSLAAHNVRQQRIPWLPVRDAGPG